ncbi:TrkA C-terminal domain-containing protein [Haloferacaceae archaeon DSL9]
MGIRLDDVNKRIIYALMEDARNTSAPMIAEDVGVTSATIRNRIARLEEEGVITGYHAIVDFGTADGLLTNLFYCTVPVQNQERIAKEAQTIAGIIDIRTLHSSRRNLHILAVGKDANSLRNIAHDLTEMGIKIEDEALLSEQLPQTYASFGPDEEAAHEKPADFVSLSGGAEVTEVTIPEAAPIVGLTLSEANDRGLLEEDTLLISIERDGDVLTPKGSTMIKPDDLLTVLSRHGISDSVLSPFRA